MKRVVIFTVGFHARATYRHLARQTDRRVVAFVDNDPAAQGTQLFGLPILNPRNLATIGFDLVAVPGRHQGAIIAQLRDQLGVAAARIWRVSKSEVRPAADELERRGADLAVLLRRTVAVLDAAGADYWTMHSGLLGLMRGQELALFSDLDLCVAAEGFDALDATFRREGFKVTSIPALDGRSLGQISVEVKPDRPGDEPAMIDLHPIAVGPVDAVWPVNHKPLALPAGLFRGYSLREYRGLPVRVPVDSAAVLAELYGADWHRPAETWNGRYALPAPVAAAF